MRPLSLSVAAALGLTACLSDPAKSDPYAGMPCEQKIAAIAKDIQEFHASQAPAAKPSARRSDTTQSDTVKTDSARLVIRSFHGYPPVAGMGPVPDTGGIITRDRPGTGNAGSTGSSIGVQWIAPVSLGPPSPGSLPVTSNPVPEVTTPSTLPGSISTLKIVSGGAYMARVRIHDFRDTRVREFDQDFGYRGELGNPSRVVDGGLVSYLAWDGKDASGRTAPSGVYLWKVRLELESKQVVEKTSKTGFIGEECRQEP